MLILNTNSSNPHKTVDQVFLVPELLPSPRTGWRQVAHESGGMDEYRCPGSGPDWRLASSGYSCPLGVRYDDNNDDDMEAYQKNS